MNFHGFLDLQGFLFDSYPPWLVNQNIFPASAGAGTFGFFFKFWGVFFVGKITTRVLGDFLRASWMDGEKPWNKFPPNLWRLSKIFGGVVVYFKGPGFGFSDPKTGLFFKNIANPITTCNRKSVAPWKLRNSENPSFLLNFWDPPKMNPGFLLKGFFFPRISNHQPTQTNN